MEGLAKIRLFHGLLSRRISYISPVISKFDPFNIMKLTIFLPLLALASSAAISTSNIIQLEECFNSVLNVNVTAVTPGVEDENIHIDLHEDAPEIAQDHIEDLKKCLRQFAGNRSVSFSSWTNENDDHIFNVMFYNEPPGTTFKQVIARYVEDSKKQESRNFEYGSMLVLYYASTSRLFQSSRSRHHAFLKAGGSLFLY